MPCHRMYGVRKGCNMDPENGVAWGLYTICGKLMRCIDITEKNGSGHGKDLMQGDLHKKANGATVRIFIDMDAQKLEFQVCSTA